jgi:MSHA biogenesis protein MshM
MSMYLAHFGLAEAPFKITPHTEFFFAGANRGETLDALVYAIMSGEGMVKVTGEVGSGKTMLCRVLMERLPAEVETIYLAVPSISRDEILATIAGDLGIEATGQTTTKLIRALQQRLIDLHVAGKQVVALIDEAHAMPLETLEEIRLLSNLETKRDKLMQIVLFGQPELDAHLALPNMRQLRERITHGFALQPLPPREIGEYLNFRLRQAGYKGPDLFRADSVKVIAEASEGLTRRINIFADKTLLAAYADGTHDVTAKHARAAVADTQIVMAAPAASGMRWKVAAAVAIGLFLGAVAGYLVGRNEAERSQVAANAIAPRAIAAAPVSPTVSRERPPVADASPAPAAQGANAPTERAAKSEIAAGQVAEKTVVAAAKPNAAEGASAQAAPGQDWLDARMQADISRLNAGKGTGFAIQLMTAEETESAAIRDFLRAAERELEAERIMVFPSGTPDNRKVSVVYGQYGDRGDAWIEIGKLSAKLRQFRPYVRTIDAVRADLRSRAG